MLNSGALYVRGWTLALICMTVVIVVHCYYYCCCCGQAGSKQAESNLKFLLALREPCNFLAEATPPDIHSLLPRILTIVRAIWVNSEYYRTMELITQLLKKVFISCFAYFHQFSKARILQMSCCSLCFNVQAFVRHVMWKYRLTAAYVQACVCVMVINTGNRVWLDDLLNSIHVANHLSIICVH